MTQFKQSAAWWCFVASNRLSPEAFVRTAAEIGYAGIDLVPREFIPLVKSHGLVVSAVGGHASLTLGLNRREQHDRIERELRENIAYAAEQGIPNLICFSGNRDGISEDEGAANTAEGLSRVAKVAENAGVTLVLELLNSKVDHPDYQCDHTPWGVQVCEMVNSPRVRLLYDIYHMQIMEGDLIRTIRDHNQWFAHYHTAGNPGRKDLDSAQEIFYPPVLTAIKNTGYTQYIAHEFVPKGDAAQALKHAFDLCAPYV
jgi:hydroxypyruvate isomerase